MSAQLSPPRSLPLREATDRVQAALADVRQKGGSARPLGGNLVEVEDDFAHAVAFFLNHGHWPVNAPPPAAPEAPLTDEAELEPEPEPEPGLEPPALDLSEEVAPPKPRGRPRKIVVEEASDAG